MESASCLLPFHLSMANFDVYLVGGMLLRNKRATGFPGKFQYFRRNILFRVVGETQAKHLLSVSCFVWLCVKIKLFYFDYLLIIISQIAIN